MEVYYETEDKKAKIIHIVLYRSGRMEIEKKVSNQKKIGRKI